MSFSSGPPLPSVPLLIFAPDFPMLIAVVVTLVLGIIAWKHLKQRRKLLTIAFVVWMFPIFLAALAFVTYPNLTVFGLETLVGVVIAIVLAVQATRTKPQRAKIQPL